MIFAIVIMTNKKSDDYRRPNYDYTAVIYHSEMLGMDAGDEYIYHIYPSSLESNNSYFYIKSKSKITIMGSGDSIDVDSDSIDNKSDLQKIEKDIKKDSRNNRMTTISYYYVNNGKSEKYKTIEDLGNILFK